VVAAEHSNRYPGPEVGGVTSIWIFRRKREVPFKCTRSSEETDRLKVPKFVVIGVPEEVLMDG
jgi:hypothetical protein